MGNNLSAQKSLSSHQEIPSFDFPDELITVFLNAVGNADFTQVQSLVSDHVGIINAEGFWAEGGYEGVSALWVASGMGHLALGEYLLSEGADSCFVSKKCSGFSCLGNACGSSNLKFVTLLLWAGADPDVLSDHGSPPLDIISDLKIQKEMKILSNAIRADCSSNTLFSLTMHGRVHELENLLSSQPLFDIDFTFPHTGATLLVVAGLSSRTGTVELLLSRGANLTVARKGGKRLKDEIRNPSILRLLQRSIEQEQKKLGAQVLIAVECKSVNDVDNVGDSLLLRCIKFGCSHEAILLIEHGADIRTLDKDGNCALGLSLRESLPAVVSSLLLRDADVNFFGLNNNSKSVIDELFSSSLEKLPTLFFEKASAVAGSVPLHQESALKGFLRDDEDFMALAVLFDLPFDLSPPHGPKLNRGSRAFTFLWSRLLNPEHPANSRPSSQKKLEGSVRARIVMKVLKCCPRQLQRLLKNANDENGREVFALTDKQTKEAINSVIFFCGRYDVNWAESPLHISDNCIVLRGSDHKAASQYSAAFTSFTEASGQETIQLGQLADCMSALGGYSKVGAAVAADVQRVFRSPLEKTALTAAEFVKFCTVVQGVTRPVVIKFIAKKELYLKEVNIRQQQNLSPRYVMGICESPSCDEFTETAKQLDIHIQGKELRNFPYGFIMQQGDRSLHAMFMSERPNLAHCQSYLKEIALALQHLHSQGVVHHDVKPVNILRHDSRMILIDLNSTSLAGDGIGYSGGNFSSGVLPPEAFAQLKTDAQLSQYLEHFNYVDRQSSLWGKIQPVETEIGRYVVRTYSDLPTTATKPLPYELVRSHVTQDMWGFGCLAYMLFTGHSLVSVNREDDLAGPDALAQAVSWTDKSILRHLMKRNHLIKDKKALDLLVKLLKFKPADRFQNMADVLCHPFFTEVVNGDGHSNRKDTQFIDFVKSQRVVRLDDAEPIFDKKWRFRRADLAMTGAIALTSLKEPVEVQAECDKLLELTRKVCKETVATINKLPASGRALLEQKVADESRTFEEVLSSILTNLVISQEPQQAQALNDMLPLLKEAVENEFPSKPRQTACAIVELYSHAVAAVDPFKQVIEHISSLVKSKFEVAPIKAYLRVSEKLVLDYEGDVNRVVDLVRGKLLCDSVHQMSQTILALVSLDPTLVSQVGSLASLQKRQLKPVQHAVAMSHQTAENATKKGLQSSTLHGTGTHAQVPRIRIVTVKNRLGFLGDCLLNFTLVNDANKHICEVQISLNKVEVARGSALGGHDSYNWVRSVASFLKVSQRSSLPLPSAKSVHFPEAGVLDDGVDAVVDISSWAQPSLSPRDNDHLSVSRAQSLRLRVLSSRIEELERELQAKKDERKSLLNSLDSPI